VKLLFVVDSFGGGAGNVIQILANAFAEKGNDASVLLLNGKRVESKYDLSKINVIDYPLGKYAKGHTPVDRIYKSVKAIRKQFDSIQPDVIISFLTELNILCCMANKKNIPLIVSERNDPAKDNVKKYWKLLRNKYYKKADRVVVQCSNFKEFAGGRFKENCSVIPNPILEPAAVRSGYELHSPVRLISLGRLQAQKNFKWMIDRMEELKAINNNFVLSIYGSGVLKDELDEYIKQKGLQDHVKLAGYAVDTYSALAESDIYLMTSDYEGFPNALSEAMAVGLPSVSRLCHEGIRDLVQDGTNGFLVEKDQCQLFVERILSLCQDHQLYSLIGKSAKDVACTFSVERIVSMWKQEIDRCMGK